MSEQPEPLIIDVDTGIDDAFALLYACAQTQARILGVSTVVGNVSLAAATRNTRAVLALAGRADIPVWPGAATAIANAVRDASEIHGETGLGHAVLPEPERSAAGVACGGFDHRRGAFACRAACSLRGGAAHQYRARRHARARAAAPRQALRHHGRGLCRFRKCDALRRIQHLARSGGGAHRLSRFRRRWRSASDRDRSRRHAQDDHRRARCRGDRLAHRRQAAWGQARPLSRGRVALLFRAHGENPGQAHLHHARPARGRRGARSDAGRNAPRGRRRRDRRGG